jgi:regulator of chromosome condensation
MAAKKKAVASKRKPAAPPAAASEAITSAPAAVRARRPAAEAPAAKKRRIAREYRLGPEGDVFCWGSNDFGMLGHGEGEPERSRPARVDLGEARAVQVACGGMHTVALTADGAVLTWGVNDEGALGRPTSGTAWQGSKEEKEDSFTPGRARLPEGERAPAPARSVGCGAAGRGARACRGQRAATPWRGAAPHPEPPLLTCCWQLGR